MTNSEESDRQTNLDWELISVIVITTATVTIIWWAGFRLLSTPTTTLIQYDAIVVGFAEVLVTGVLTYLILRIYKEQNVLVERQNEISEEQGEMISKQTKLLNASHQPIISLDYEPRGEKPGSDDSDPQQGDYLLLKMENQGTEVARDIRMSFHIRALGDSEITSELSSKAYPIEYVDKRILSSQSNGAVLTPDMGVERFSRKVQLSRNGEPRSFRHFMQALEENHFPVLFWMVIHFRNAANESYHIVIDPPMKWDSPIGDQPFKSAFDATNSTTLKKLHQIVDNPETD